MKFKELGGVLCRKKWSVKLKGKIYKACVRTVMIIRWGNLGNEERGGGSVAES